mmetsp:Transcript_21754/g.66950  ORF Transcript_21754/g.66950 Transcript_21754/m.66950 type:complete len:260 (+) Transcript_21754:136-915(+)
MRRARACVVVGAAAVATALQFPWAAKAPPRPLGQVDELTYDAPLAVGTWQAGNRLLYDYSVERDADLKAAWARAAERGAKYFDTGDSYGTGELEGRAERLLGAFAATAPSEPWIHSKLATYPWRLRPDDFVRACEASRDRLGRPVTLVGQHWSAETYGLGAVQDPAVYRGLAKCCDAGLAKGVGLSNLGPAGLRKGVDAVNAAGARVATHATATPRPPARERFRAARASIEQPAPDEARVGGLGQRRAARKLRTGQAVD